MINLKQKKGWLIRDFLIAGVLFGLVMGLFVIGIADTSNNYSNIPGVNHNVINPKMAAHYDIITSQLSKMNGMVSAVQSSGGLSIIGTFDIAFNSVFTVISLLWQSLLIFTGMAAFIPTDFNFLPFEPINLFLMGILAIVSIYLIMVWLSSIMRGKI